MGGEYEVKHPAPSRLPLFLGIAVLLALALIAAVVLLATGGTITTTTTFKSAVLPNLPAKICKLWGDPHVQTFDNTKVPWYNEGEYWIVKSSTVSIQGRFLATQYTNGLAATHQIVVGGAFMQSHTVTVGPMENGGITCDGVPALSQFPSSATCGPASLRYDQGDVSALVDQAQSHLERHILTMDLPEGINVQVMRWANHLNVRITMSPRPDGQDGACGNNNNDPNDDAEAVLKARIGAIIPSGQLLFHHQAQVAPAAPIKTLADCAQQKREDAKNACTKRMPTAGTADLDSCIFDECFAGPQYAAEDALAI